MRMIALAFAAVVCAFSSCHREPNGSSIDRTQAKTVSDLYMSDLVADRVDLAVERMEPQFIQAAGGNAKAEAQLRDLLNYCGRPLESELSHEGLGFFSMATDVEHRCVRFITQAELLNTQRVFAFLPLKWCRAKTESR